METPFSRAPLRCDHVPPDAEIACLLSDFDHPGHIAVVDTPQSLVARPGLIPMRFAATWLIVIASAITAGLWWIPAGGRLAGPQLNLAMTALVWLAVVPAFLGVLAAINRHFAGKGDYFRADKAGRRLELCPLGRTLDAGEIVAFTEVSRWFMNPLVRSWDWTRQVGAVVRHPSGGYELLPLVREMEVRPFRPRLADQLAAIFDVPVRRIRVSWRDSRSLRTEATLH